MKKIITYLTAATLTAGLLSGLYAWTNTLATAGEMQVVRTQIKLLHQKFEADQRIRREQAIQERLWTLSDRYENKPMPQSTKEEKRSLEAELARLRGDKWTPK